MKKITGVFLAIVFVVCLSTNAFAKTIPVVNEGGDVRPQYNNIVMFDACGDIYATSASGNAYAIITSGYRGELKLVLERDTGSGFKTYATIGTGKTSSTGTTMSASGERDNLSSSYRYRIKANIYVYNSNGTLVDSDYIYIT
ncbi:MAG TPA: hypothetical protein DEP23_13920 [Ruminococcaceae bacterium]|nr:hypothetical protein [Oscillospiraceae bacterium]